MNSILEKIRKGDYNSKKDYDPYDPPLEVLAEIHTLQSSLREDILKECNLQNHPFKDEIWEMADRQGLTYEIKYLICAKIARWVYSGGSYGSGRHQSSLE